jgi:hypothetical protein
LHKYFERVILTVEIRSYDTFAVSGKAHLATIDSNVADLCRGSVSDTIAFRRFFYGAIAAGTLCSPTTKFGL